MATEFGDGVRSAREAAGVSRKQLGDRLGISAGAVEQIEAGRNPVQDEDRRREIMAAIAASDPNAAALVRAATKEIVARMAKLERDLVAMKTARPDPRPVAEAFGKAKVAAGSPPRQQARKG